MADDFLAIADLVADALDLSGNEVNDLREAAPLISRLPVVESSNGETHKYSKYTQSPVVGFRAPNAGRDMDQSVDTIVTVTLKLLDFSWAVDKGIADVWRKGREHLIAREGMRHVKAALWYLEKQFIRGTTNDASGFSGLEQSTYLDALADTGNVVNAGGTTAATASSCYLLRVNDNEICSVLKGDGVELGDTLLQDFTDGTGKHYPAYYTPGCLWGGAQLGGAYSAVRIVNLTADAGKGLTDDLIYQGMKLFPAGQGPNLIVTNKRSQEQLRSSRTATNQTGAPAPIPMEVAGVPLITTDAIVETEALIA